MSLLYFNGFRCIFSCIAVLFFEFNSKCRPITNLIHVLAVVSVVLLRQQVHLVNRVGNLGSLHAARVEGIVDVVRGRERVVGRRVGRGGVRARRVFSR